MWSYISKWAIHRYYLRWRISHGKNRLNKRQECACVDQRAESSVGQNHYLRLCIRYMHLIDGGNVDPDGQTIDITVRSLAGHDRQDLVRNVYENVRFRLPIIPDRSRRENDWNRSLINHFLSQNSRSIGT